MPEKCRVALRSGYCHGAPRMTIATVQVKTIGLGLVGLGEFSRLRLVLVTMVSKMLGSHTCFMLTIGGRCSQSELHRNHYQQKHSKPFAHAQHCSSFKFYDTRALTIRARMESWCVRGHEKICPNMLEERGKEPSHRCVERCINLLSCPMNVMQDHSGLTPMRRPG